MEMGMVGLGRMGGNMVQRLLARGHRIVATNRSKEPIEVAERHGAAGAHSLEDFVAAFKDRPRVMWLMLPAGKPTSATIQRLAELGDHGDIIIDGGNTNWKVALEDAAVVKEHGVHYMDAGVSGGIWGLENGYCLMVGGDKRNYDHCLPLLKDLAPEGGGLVHTGPEGSGHFVKMVHNGIEYGLMQAYADGLKQDPKLSHVRGYVEDTGEGRWTVETAIEESVPAPIIAHSLFVRFRSRMEDTFGDKMLAMMRNQFGGHAIKTEPDGAGQAAEKTSS
jgi:6-phosphogluconate dehydrogenase